MRVGVDDAVVADHSIRTTTEGLNHRRRLLRGLLVDVSDDHISALSGKGRRSGPADAAATSGDQNDLLGETVGADCPVRGLGEPQPRGSA